MHTQTPNGNACCLNKTARKQKAIRSIYKMLQNCDEPYKFVCLQRLKSTVYAYITGEAVKYFF